MMFKYTLLFFMDIFVVIFAFHEQEVRESYRHVRSAHHDSDEHIENAKLVYCEENHCELISRFKLAKNNTLNCYDQYLGITFEILIINKHGNDTMKVDVYSWLFNDERDDNQDYKLLSNGQKTSTFCKQIRR